MEFVIVAVAFAIAIAIFFVLRALGRLLFRRRSHYKVRHAEPVVPFSGSTSELNESNLSDPNVQMEFVSRVEFEPRRLLNKSEYPILRILEQVVREVGNGHRVMAQTSMGEIVTPKNSTASEEDCDLAYRSINSKRLDFLVINKYGIPTLAIEYQGGGHFRPKSFMRDAVKREALRKAGIAFLEVPENYKTTDLKAQVRSMLQTD